MPKYKSIDEVLTKLETAYGHSFKEYDINHRLDHSGNKGALGQIVEEGILGYPVNSRPEADLAELGIEVKTTGIIKNKNGAIRAKERLTIDNLNYMKIVDFSFEESPMWQKADDMLFVFYNYLKGINLGDMKIIKAALNQFTNEDRAIIEKDYKIIQDKIKAGKAEEISESDTMYLGACTSGTGREISQPFSRVKAKERKFCLKQSFFSSLANRYISKREYESVGIDIRELEKATFEMAITAKINVFKGKSENALAKMFHLSGCSAKNRYDRMLAAMLGIKSGSISKTEEFVKAGIQVKTVRVREDGTIKEHISFPAFDFIDLTNQEWETSDLRDLFASSKFMIAVFREKNGKLVFDGVRFWHMPEQVLDSEVRLVFERTKSILLQGNIVKGTHLQNDGKLIRETNFPGSSENPVCHVRPHARNADDVALLPVKDKFTGDRFFTKQCFWLNHSYVEDIVNG